MASFNLFCNEFQKERKKLKDKIVEEKIISQFTFLRYSRSMCFQENDRKNNNNCSKQVKI